MSALQVVIAILASFLLYVLFSKKNTQSYRDSRKTLLRLISTDDANDWDDTESKILKLLRRKSVQEFVKKRVRQGSPLSDTLYRYRPNGSAHALLSLLHVEQFERPTAVKEFLAKVMPANHADLSFNRMVVLTSLVDYLVEAPPPSVSLDTQELQKMRSHVDAIEARTTEEEEEKEDFLMLLDKRIWSRGLKRRRQHDDELGARTPKRARHHQNYNEALLARVIEQARSVGITLRKMSHSDLDYIGTHFVTLCRHVPLFAGMEDESVLPGIFADGLSWVAIYENEIVGFSFMQHGAHTLVDVLRENYFYQTQRADQIRDYLTPGSIAHFFPPYLSQRAFEGLISGQDRVIELNFICAKKLGLRPGVGSYLIAASLLDNIDKFDTVLLQVGDVDVDDDEMALEEFTAIVREQPSTKLYERVGFQHLGLTQLPLMAFADKSALVNFAAQLTHQ